MRRLEICARIARRRGESFLASVEHLIDLEVCQPVNPMVGVCHGLARRFLGASGSRHGAEVTSVAGAVICGVAVAAVAGFDEARKDVGEQWAEGDYAGTYDADVDFDYAVVGHGGAVPAHVEG